MSPIKPATVNVIETTVIPIRARVAMKDLVHIRSGKSQYDGTNEFLPKCLTLVIGAFQRKSLFQTVIISYCYYYSQSLSCIDQVLYSSIYGECAAETNRPRSHTYTMARSPQPGDQYRMLFDLILITY